MSNVQKKAKVISLVNREWNKMQRDQSTLRDRPQLRSARVDNENFNSGKKKRNGKKVSGATTDSTKGLNYHSGSQAGLKFSMAPTTSGVANITYKFMPSGLPNRSDNHDYRFGVKVVGSEIIAPPIATFSSGTGVFSPGASTNIIMGSIGNLFSAGSRVIQFATIYGYYSIRRLKVHYIPIVGSTAAGAFSIGVVEDIQAATTIAAAPATIQTVSQCESSTTNNAWLPKVVLQYTFAGTRDFSTQSASEDTNDSIQFALLGAQSGMTVSTVYGFLFAEYEIDFYSPQTVVASPALRNMPLNALLISRRKEGSTDHLQVEEEKCSTMQMGCSSSSMTPLRRQEVVRDQEEFVAVERQTSRSSSQPPVSRSVDRDTSGNWFSKPVPAKLSS